MKNKKLRSNFPPNVLVLATHGSAAVPNALQKQLHENFSPRLQKNFSDFGTKCLLKNVPKHQTACPRFGRIVGDANRSAVGSDVFRETDFNHNKIWKQPLSNKQKKHFLKVSRQAYLDSVLGKIEKMCQVTKNSDPLIVIDLHDTGNTLLGSSINLDTDRSEFCMPTAIFSNQNHQTCQFDFLEKISKDFSNSFDVPTSQIECNKIFLGGFVTQFLGGLQKNEALDVILKKYNRSRKTLFVVQCELNRNLYLDETHQKIRPEIGRIRRNLESFLCSLTVT